MGAKQRKQKRARGREAQKNYMARKQAENRQLKSRIASLDSTVEAIVTEFIHFGDRQVNSSQYLNWLPLLDDLKQTTARILDQARIAESLANGQQDEGLIREVAPVNVGPTTSIDFRAPSSSSNSCPVGAHAPPQVTGHFSPQLGYGLLTKTSPIAAADEFLGRYFVSLKFPCDFSWSIIVRGSTENYVLSPIFLANRSPDQIHSHSDCTKIPSSSVFEFCKEISQSLASSPALCDIGSGTRILTIMSPRHQTSSKSCLSTALPRTAYLERRLRQRTRVASCSLVLLIQS